MISYEEFHPFGTSAYRAFNSSFVSARRYRYTGKERDDETGLYYHGARYYAAWLGRWTATDPSGIVDGVNLFAYVRGNPIALNDPNGLKSNDDAPPSPPPAITIEYGREETFAHVDFKKLDRRTAAVAKRTQEQFRELFGIEMDLVRQSSLVGGRPTYNLSLKNFNRAGPTSGLQKGAAYQKVVANIRAAVAAELGDAPKARRDAEVATRIKRLDAFRNYAVSAFLAGVSLQVEVKKYERRSLGGEKNIPTLTDNPIYGLETIPRALGDDVVINPFFYGPSGKHLGSRGQVERWGPAILLLHEYAHTSRKLPGGRKLPSQKESMSDKDFDEEGFIVKQFNQALKGLPGLADRNTYSIGYGKLHKRGKEWIRMTTKSLLLGH